jgi:mono/diheme cytochrome c family protein
MKRPTRNFTAPRIAALVGALLMAAQASAAGAPDGKALYKERCGMCHQTIGMAVSILSRRPADPSKGMLEERTDLSAAFIRTVVRTGIMNMPRMPRGEVSDAELAAIANYLSRGKP